MHSSYFFAPGPRSRGRGLPLYLHIASGVTIPLVCGKMQEVGCILRAAIEMRKTRRSECPVNLTVEMLGDRWSLIVIRDVMFGDRRHYNDLLRLSEEGIASNILADRLNRFVRVGLLTRRKDPTHKQKAIYSLTEASIELVPLMAHVITWARKHTPASKDPSTGKTLRGQLVEEGDERMWNAFMAELRAEHLGAPRPRASVFAKRLAVLEADRGRRTRR